MATIKFHKVTAVPGTWQADSVYFVTGNPGEADLYITDSSAVPRQVINTSGGGGTNPMLVVADITERDGLSLSENALVFVIDATADGTVDSGAATYIYRHSNTSFTKVSEAESLDVVLDWADIQNRPASSASAIDSAVSNSHTHANKTQLDLISQDGSGELLYNGSNIASRLETADW